MTNAVGRSSKREETIEDFFLQVHQRRRKSLVVSNGGQPTLLVQRGMSISFERGGRFCGENRRLYF